MSCGDSQVSRWYVLRTTQNGDFVLLPLCRALLAHSRLVGAVALGWRSGARARCCFLPLVLALCRARAHFCWMFILTHATALKPSHSNKSCPLHHLQQIISRPGADVLLSFRCVQPQSTRRAQVGSGGDTVRYAGGGAHTWLFGRPTPYDDWGLLRRTWEQTAIPW